MILLFHLEVHLWRCAHKRALMGQQKTSLEGSRQSTSRGCSGDQSTSTGSKGINLWNQTFSTFHIFLFWQHISCLQNPVWFKKTQTKQCHFLIIKREKKVCDEKVKDGIIDNTGASNKKLQKVTKSVITSSLSSTLNWTRGFLCFSKENCPRRVSWIKGSPPRNIVYVLHSFM